MWTPSNGEDTGPNYRDPMTLQEYEYVCQQLTELEQVCSICTESAAEYQTPCGHYFHADCLLTHTCATREWNNQPDGSDGAATGGWSGGMGDRGKEGYLHAHRCCPICRAELFPVPTAPQVPTPAPAPAPTPAPALAQTDRGIQQIFPDADFEHGDRVIYDGREGIVSLELGGSIADDTTQKVTLLPLTATRTYISILMMVCGKPIFR